MRKINNNYIKFDSSTKFNTNNQYFSTGLHNRPYLKMPGIEWVNDIKTGDMSAFRKYLTIRKGYHRRYADNDWRHYYDDLLLLPLLHEDIRLKLIHHILDEGQLPEVIDALQILAHNYNLDKFKKELKPKFSKRLPHMYEYYPERGGGYSLLSGARIEQWNGIVSSVFPESNELIVPIENATPEPEPEPFNEDPFNEDPIWEKHMNMTDEELGSLLDSVPYWL
jgi:hypothetical protein